MLSEDDIRYAAENTEVILAPRRRIATFGSTVFRFWLVTEPMDSVNQTRVRQGLISAERPQILVPGHHGQVPFEGFGDKADEFAEWMRRHRDRFRLLRYGFRIKRTEFHENLVPRPSDDVIEGVLRDIDRLGDDAAETHALIRGIDDAWEVCLLKFTVDLIQSSISGNMDDFQGKGLL
jgi:hypothetical protein